MDLLVQAIEELSKAIDHDSKEHMGRKVGDTLDQSAPPHIDRSIRMLGFQVPINHFMTPEYVKDHNLEGSIDSFDKTVMHPKVKVDRAHGLGGASDKIAFRHGEDLFIMKPFHSNIYSAPTGNGFSELASQSLYHAAGIGHLHQKVFPVSTDAGDYVVIHGRPNEHNTATHVGEDLYKPLDLYGNPLGPSRYLDLVKGQVGNLLKIGFMDHLLGNSDRHGGNLLFHNNGTPLAIDNSMLFDEESNYAEKIVKLAPGRVIRRIHHNVAGDEHATVDKFDHIRKYFPNESREVGDWWLQNSQKIKEKFEQNLAGMHPVGAAKIRKVFDEKHSLLTELSNGLVSKDPATPLTTFKSLDRSVSNIKDPIHRFDKFPEVPGRRFIPVSDINPEEP